VRPRRPRQGRRLSDGTVVVTTPDDEGRIIHAIRYGRLDGAGARGARGRARRDGLRWGQRRRGLDAFGGEARDCGGSRGLGDAKSCGSSSSVALAALSPPTGELLKKLARSVKVEARSFGGKTRRRGPSGRNACEPAVDPSPDRRRRDALSTQVRDDARGRTSGSSLSSVRQATVSRDGADRRRRAGDRPARLADATTRLAMVDWFRRLGLDARFEADGPRLAD